MSASVSAITLSQGTPEWMFAVDIIIVGILLAGIALGIGMATRSRRVWAWGIEELAQAIINAAMLGALFAWIASVDGITSGWVDSSSLICHNLKGENLPITNAPLFFCRCALENIHSQTVPLINSLATISYKLGWLSTMSLSLNVVSATPFASFADTSSSYSAWSISFSSLLSAADLQMQFLAIVAASALTLFLPAGLLLRMFFATRKLGGAIMAGAIGFFIVYPIIFASLLPAQLALANLTSASSSITSSLNSFSAVPVIDFGKSEAISNLIINLSGGNIAVTSVAPYSALSAARASLELSLIVFPLLALLLTAVAIRELYAVLSSEFNLNLFEMV